MMQTSQAFNLRFNIGIIGLGVMGRRMLARMSGHSRLHACVVWDADPAAVARALAEYPGLRAASSAEALIASAELQGLYIATPPAAHLHLSKLAFDVGLKVLCEKPLTTDFIGARISITRIEAEQRVAGVNFALASTPALAALQSAFGEGSARPFGELKAVEITLAFAAWPRPWQAAAGTWLAERIEGGFSREVLSHFIFALQRVLGAATVIESEVDYPADGISSETRLRAKLHCRGVPVTIDAHIGGNSADDNAMIWRVADGMIELREWFSKAQQRTADGPWQSLAVTAQPDQLAQWAAMLDGAPHALPGYAESLAVQETIERLLQMNKE